MKQSEEMRKAIQSTEFVQFDESSGGQAAAAAAAGEDGHRSAPPPQPAEAAVVPGPAARPSAAQEKKEVFVPPSDDKVEGKVREWNSEKGFGFIVPLGSKEGEETAKSVFVHLWNVVGSTHSHPINLQEGARVLYKLGEQ